MSEPFKDTAAGDGPATIQSRLERADDGELQTAAVYRPGGAPSMTDAAELLRGLDHSGRFHRDGLAGRLFHRGMVSLRENVATDSLHISVDGNRLAAHVDGVSPLAADADGPSRYSARRILVHNLSGMAMDLIWLLRGRQGDHSCTLNCEWITGDAEPRQADLLDPESAAWSVQAEARVAGSLDEARLRSALTTVLERDSLEVVDCADDGELAAARTRLQSTAVAVSDRPPLHAYLARHPGGDVLMLNFNHAAADGFAALQVLRSIADVYAGDAGEPPAPLDFLALRDLPVRPASPPTSILARSFKKAVEGMRDALSRTGRLAADGSSDRPGYGFHMVALSAHDTADVVYAERTGTSGDVLMAALHLAIGNWNLEHGTPGRRIGVLVPANLRPDEWQEEAIGNFSVTARVSSSRRERAGPATALKTITTQTSRNKRTRTGIALIAGLQRGGLLALWAKQSTIVLQPLTGNRLVDTAMLCDLGALDRAPQFGTGAGELTELWCSIPTRSALSLCLGAVTVGGRLHLTVRYPHRLFSRDAARRFTACYLDHVRMVADVRT